MTKLIHERRCGFFRMTTDDDYTLSHCFYKRVYRYNHKKVSKEEFYDIIENCDEMEYPSNAVESNI